VKRGSKVAEEIARDILGGICKDGLQVGSQLPGEAQMLAKYGVGRGSLREALRILEVHGVIKIKAGPGGGPVVTGATTRDFGRMATIFFQAGGMTFRDLIDLRLILEPMGARLAAERADPTLIQELLATETSTKNDAEYLRTSEAFHRQVARMSNNAMLSMISHAMEDIFHDRVAGMLFPPGQRDEVVKAHEDIARAIADRDGDRAEKLMRDHMSVYVRYVGELYPVLLDEVVAWR
jgi:GntR family transcriptional regulator, transcriptional repressor for pyruvate dehydrogenase complex